MLFEGQLQAHLTGGNIPALLAAGSRPEHELKWPECHRRILSHSQEVADAHVHPWASFWVGQDGGASRGSGGTAQGNMLDGASSLW